MTLYRFSNDNSKIWKGEKMNFEDIGAIIDFAIEKEREEQKHEKILQDFKTKGISKSLEEYQLKWITDIKRSDYLVDLSYEKGMPYNEILLLAMKREEKALKLYNDFLEQADTDESKKLFKVLCQEEAKHKLALETIYDDYMAKMGD
jgi:hypothetical protein